MSEICYDVFTRFSTYLLKNDIWKVNDILIENLKNIYIYDFLDLGHQNFPFDTKSMQTKSESFKIT